MRPIDADALMDDIKRDSKKAIDDGDKVGSFWIGYIAGLVIKQPTAQPSTSDLISRTETIEKIQVGITATNSNDAYSLGMRNGMRWCKALLDGKEPKFEHAKQYVQPEPQWIPVSERLPETEEFVLASLTGKYRNTTFEHACEIADYADGEWCVYAYPHMSAEKCEELIEAWMPLPEPYKPNKKQSGKEGA